jgi:hypothetical protein
MDLLIRMGLAGCSGFEEEAASDESADWMREKAWRGELRIGKSLQADGTPELFRDRTPLGAKTGSVLVFFPASPSSTLLYRYRPKVIGRNAVYAERRDVQLKRRPH